MKSKKVAMLAAVLVVAVVALAGVGYATIYKAETSNTENYMDSTYLTLTQSGEAAYTKNFLKNIYFDTETEAEWNTSTEVFDETITYTPVLDYIVVDTTTYRPAASNETATLALASQVLDLLLTPVNNDEPTVTLNVEATEFTPIDDLEYTLVVATASSNGTLTGAKAFTPVQGEDGKWTTTVSFATEAVGEENVTVATHYYIALFISGSTDNDSDIATAGFASESDSSKTVFKFTATANTEHPSNP